MRDEFGKNTGVSRLYRRYQRAFRIPENLDYYSPEDFKRAQRKFIKLGLTRGFEIDTGLDGP